MNLDHQTPEGDGSTPHLLFITAMLWTVSGFFHVLASFTIDDIYTWVYRILSVILVCLGLYINWPKAVDQWKKRKSKKTKRG